MGDCTRTAPLFCDVKKIRQTLRSVQRRVMSRAFLRVLVALVVSVVLGLLPTAGCDCRRDHRLQPALEQVVLPRCYDVKKVPNVTVHVIEGLSTGAGRTAPHLRVVKRIVLPLDANHRALVNRNRCPYLKVGRPGKHYFHLTESLRFVLVPRSGVPHRCRFPARQRVRLRTQWKSLTLAQKEKLMSSAPSEPSSAPTLPVVLSLPVDHRVVEVPFRVHGVARASNHLWFNKGRSLLLLYREAKSHRDRVYVLPDVRAAKPRMKLWASFDHRYKHDIPWPTQRSSEVFLLRERAGQRSLIKVDPLGQGLAPDFFPISATDVVFLQHYEHASVICLGTGKLRHLRCYDDQRGQLRFQIAIKRPIYTRAGAWRLDIRRPGGRWTLIHNTLVDLTGGRVVAELPEEVRSPMLGSLRRYLYYVTGGRHLWTNPFIRLQVYDLETRVRGSHLDLHNIGAPPADPMAASIYHILRVGNDRLLAIGGVANPDASSGGRRCP